VAQENNREKERDKVNMIIASKESRHQKDKSRARCGEVKEKGQ
jgi:hypothetical protein